MSVGSEWFCMDGDEEATGVCGRDIISKGKRFLSGLDKDIIDGWGHSNVHIRLTLFFRIFGCKGGRSDRFSGPLIDLIFSTHSNWSFIFSLTVISLCPGASGSRLADKIRLSRIDRE